MIGEKQEHSVSQDTATASAAEGTTALRSQVEPCIECGMPIFLTPEQGMMLQQTGIAFYCLWGHGQSYDTPASLRNEARRAAWVEKERKLSEARQHNRWHRRLWRWLHRARSAEGTDAAQTPAKQSGIAP